MKVVATAIAGAEVPAFQPYALTIQADTAEEAHCLEQFGRLNVIIPDVLKNGDHLSLDQARTLAGIQTAVVSAHNVLKADLKAATKTSARRKKR